MIYRKYKHPIFQTQVIFGWREEKDVLWKPVVMYFCGSVSDGQWINNHKFLSNWNPAFLNNWTNPQIISEEELFLELL